MTNQPTTIDVRRGCTSASNAQADKLCPGRHLAQRGIPDSDSKDSQSGSRVHAALAKGSSEGLSLAESETFDACRAIEARKVEEFFGPDADKVKVWREERYWCRFKAGEVQLEHSGQADVVYRFGPKALVIDYKSLAGEVAESPSNMQLRDLAALVKGHFVVVDQVATLIIQPLVTHSPEVCLYDKASLDRAAAEMLARVVASNDPQSKRVAGDAQCKFCKAKTGCTEYQRYAGTIVPTVIEPVVQEGLFQVAMANWTPEQRAVAASILSPAGKRLDEIKEFLKEGMAKDPSFVPGYELSKGRTTETIKDPQACFDRFSAIGGNLTQFMGCVSVGKTKLKEAVNSVTLAKGKALDMAIKTLCEGITESKVSSGSIEKVRDK